VCDLMIHERFPYFQRLVCRARVWTDMEGILFQQLKEVAQVHGHLVYHDEVSLQT
jgi:hypothetical protein